MTITEPTADAGPTQKVAIDFVLRLGRALHNYGYAAHLLEESLELAARRLNLIGQFFSTPTSIFAAFGRQTEQHTHLIRVEPGEVDLGKLAALHDVTGAVLRERMSPGQGSQAIDDIVSARSSYGPVISTVAFGLTSGGASVFLGGGASEGAVATGIGIVIGLAALVLVRTPAVARIFEPVAAFLASLIAASAAAVLGGLSVFVATLAGLIVLLPGLTLTIAITELSTRHLVSGTARLSHAFMIFLGIAFGVALGNRLATESAPQVPIIPATPLPSWAIWIALVVAPLGFAVLLRAAIRDWPWIIGAGLVAYFGARFGTSALGNELGVFVGALSVGLASNLYARVFDRPAAVTQVPGILLLVPGSVGFRSLSRLLDRDVVLGVETAFTMILSAVALVAGLLIANVVLRPSRRLD